MGNDSVDDLRDRSAVIERDPVLGRYRLQPNLREVGQFLYAITEDSGRGWQQNVGASLRVDGLELNSALDVSEVQLIVGVDQIVRLILLLEPVRWRVRLEVDTEVKPANQAEAKQLLVLGRVFPLRPLRGCDNVGTLLRGGKKPPPALRTAFSSSSLFNRPSSEACPSTSILF